MSNLTQYQKEIINSITEQFETINVTANVQSNSIINVDEIVDDYNAKETRAKEIKIVHENLNKQILEQAERDFSKIESKLTELGISTEFKISNCKHPFFIIGEKLFTDDKFNIYYKLVYATPKYDELTGETLFSNFTLTSYTALNLLKNFDTIEDVFNNKYVKEKIKKLYATSQRRKQK